MRRLLAILMIAGLALAPVSRPVIAATSSQAPQQAMAEAMTLSEMSASDTLDETAGDMPCCPSKVRTAVDCDKCVFMAGCGSMCFAGVSAGLSHPFPILSDTIALQRSGQSRHGANCADGLGHPPPEHPPRMLV